MKRVISLIICVFLLLALLVPCVSFAVVAIPNQRLAFRTGPSTDYVELFTLPQSTDINAVEYESGSGVTWVLVEFTYNGEEYCAYTGLKRMEVKGNIPWADHMYRSVQITSDATVFAAPSYNAAYRSSVDCLDKVSLLRYDGDFAYIEFYNNDKGALDRGWVYNWIIGASIFEEEYDHSGGIDISEDLATGVYAEPNQRLAFRTGPSTGYTEIFVLPQDTDITAFEYEDGSGVTWVLVEFFYRGERYRGYTGLKRMEVYGYIPYANHNNTYLYTSYPCSVFAAPSADAAYRTSLNKNTSVLLLNVENGYAFVEFTDKETDKLIRGYIYADAVLFEYGE